MFRRSIQAMLGLSTVGTAVGATTGAISAATGAAILSKVGYAGHIAQEAAKASAAGNAVLGAAAGVATIAGCFAHHFFCRRDAGPGFDNTTSAKALAAYGGINLAYVGMQSLGASIGYGLLINTASSTLSLGSVVADVAVGAAVTSIPVTLGLICCVSVAASFAFHSPLMLNNLEQSSQEMREQPAQRPRSLSI